MIPVLPLPALGREIAACTVLGACTGAVRALFPARGRAAFLPDVAWVGTLLAAVQSYAAGESFAGVLRWYMAAAAFAGAGACRLALPGSRCRQLFAGTDSGGRYAKYAGTQKELQKNAKRTCQTGGGCCIIQTYHSKSRSAMGADIQWHRRAAGNAERIRSGRPFCACFLYCCC